MEQDQYVIQNVSTQYGNHLSALVLGDLALGLHSLLLNLHLLNKQVLGIDHIRD